MSEDYDRLKKQYDELVAKNETRRLIAPVRRGYEDGYAAGYAAALAAPPSPEALPAMLEGEYPPVLGDWLWGQLMAWCKKRGCAPASFDDLFAIVGRMRTYVDSDRASRAQASPAAASVVVAWKVETSTGDLVGIYDTARDLSAAQYYGQTITPLYAAPTGSESGDAVRALVRLERAVDLHLGRSAWTQTTRLKGLEYSAAVRKELFEAHDEARAAIQSSQPNKG